MNQTELDDLKQFILVAIGQSEARLRNELAGKADLAKLEKRFDGKIGSLREEMLDGFSSVGEALKELNDRLDKRDKEVDVRFEKLEQRIA